MGVIKCPKHGTQIASVFCEHASDAIDARKPFGLYLQRNQWGWCTLCDACVRRRDDADVQDSLMLVCGECILEWAAATGSDYVQRCQDPKPEFPP